MYNENHISYCIIPNYCNNNDQLWQLDGYSIINSSLMSYSVGTSFIDENIENIDCLRCEMCYNVYFNINLHWDYETSNIKCNGLYSCIKSNFTRKHRNNKISITIHACDSIIFTHR